MSIVVTGLHRSSTSSVAGIVADLGMDVGDVEGPDLIEASLEHPRGYFERTAVVAFNDDLLEGGARRLATCIPKE